ncbi:MAG: hypothetical protein ABI614_23995 [Planctomycetota bacterium]
MTTATRRCPFTLLMVAALIIAGIYSRTHVGPLDAAVREQVGHSVRLFFDGHLHRVFTSIFFTAGGWGFYASLVMLGGSLGWVEWVHGTRRTVLTFFGIHVATLLLLAIAVTWPLAMLETHHGKLLMHARDVGPSAGYYGCLGLAVAGLSFRMRNRIVAVILVVLVLRLICSTLHMPEEGRAMSADLAHLIAFPLGLLAFTPDGTRLTCYPPAGAAESSGSGIRYSETEVMCGVPLLKQEPLLPT